MADDGATDGRRGLLGSTPAQATGTGNHVDVHSGLTPPPPAPSGFLFKTVWKKNIHLCLKRKRFMSMIIANLLQGGISCMLYYLFRNIDSGAEYPIGLILMAAICPMNIMFGITGSFQSAYMDIIGEKESKMKIVQNVYGLTSKMYWGTWAAYYGTLSLVGISILYFLMTVVAPILIKVNVLVALAALASGFVQQFIIVFIFTIFFDSWKTASAMSSFMNIGLMAVAAGLQGALHGKSKVLFFIAGLVPTINIYSTMSSIFFMISGWVCDENGTCHQPGVTLQRLFTDSVCAIPYNNPGPCPAETELQFLSTGSSILMVLVAIVLFSLLAMWLDNVWQGEYGIAKPVFFCFDPRYICPKRQDPAIVLADETGTTGNRHVAMSMRGLRKTFGPKVAVDDMTLDMYGSEIFALLGHNGAGKTTAINCLVGLIPMTSGEAMVNGFDVRTDVDNARRQLSVCPQDNPMYDEFTVRQHLRFFASLRGVQAADVDERMGAVLQALGIDAKIDDLCITLSGGQKRRLWVATALIGQSPVVFLDEPTSGMDPSSRRELWDLLLEMKATGRCVIFTTHYLEEADVLADRKAILARGKVQAVGTSRELKMAVGVGYHLSVELKPGTSADSMGSLRSLVTKHVSTALEKHTAEEERTQAIDASASVAFTLPYSERASFGPMLLDIDAEKMSLGVEDYSLAMTSLEEVFMTLGQQAEQQAGDGHQNVDFADVEVDSTSAQRVEVSEWRGIKAMAHVRVKAMLSNQRAAISVCFMPIIFLLIAFFSAPTSDDVQANPDTFIFIPMSFGMTTIAFSMDIVRDRVSKVKYVAMAQGLTPKSYWLGTALGHLKLSLLIVAAVVILTITVKPGGMQTNSLPMVVLMELIYPVNNLLFAYNVATAFKTPELAMKVLPLMNLFAGMVPSLIVWAFESPVILGTSPWTGIAAVIHVVMSLINPLYSFPGMLVFLLSSDQTWMAAVPLYLAPVSFLLLAGNLVRMDRKSYSNMPGDFTDFGDIKKDADVKAEEHRCQEEPDTNEAARYHGLSHTYKTKVDGKWKETHAVRGISLGIRKGECFGLLGPNGAGKTTTLAVLTGEVRPPTRGKVSIFGNDMSSPEGLDAAYKVLGVCPQVDPIWEDLNGFEHLAFYGRVKGIPEASLKATVDALLRRLGLEEEAAVRRAGSYSGGMKRKLSVGIALIGHSPMLFLDEPSAAVDAGAKRHLWKVIKRRGPDQTVVLTTHSMEEAEALCDRIAIQVQGQLRCIGSPAHIKRKYGAGYQLELFLQTPMHRANSEKLQIASGGSWKQAETEGPSDAILGFVKEQVTIGAELLESHAARYLFQLPPVERGGASLGHIFSTIQKHMESMGIIDFSITQPSLEQVFLRFAKEQSSEENQT